MKKYISTLFLVGFLMVPGLSFAQQADVNPAGTSACADINANIGFGNRDSDVNSNAVSMLQDFLSTSGFLTATPSGYFGSATLKAIKAFQAANGISPTGYVGALTRAKIKDIDCNGGTAGTAPASPIQQPVSPTVDNSSVNNPATVNPVVPNLSVNPLIKGESENSSVNKGESESENSSVSKNENESENSSVSKNENEGENSSVNKGEGENSNANGNNADCSAGDKFSSKTGQLCSSIAPVVYPEGCNANFAFSPVTGKSCSVTSSTQ